MKPDPSWGPANAVNRTGRYARRTATDRYLDDFHHYDDPDCKVLPPVYSVNNAYQTDWDDVDREASLRTEF